MKVYWNNSQILIICKDYLPIRFDSRMKGDVDKVKKVSSRPDVGDIIIQFKDDTYTHAKPGVLTFQ